MSAGEAEEGPFRNDPDCRCLRVERRAHETGFWWECLRCERRFFRGAVQSRETPPEMDTAIRFGGRTLMLDVAVNTDENPHEVCERVRVAAAGPLLRMAMVAARIVSGPDALSLWKAAARMARGTAGTTS